MRRAARRPRPLPGRAGDAARDDAGQRGGRDRVRPRGSGRRAARAGRRQRGRRARRARRARSRRRGPRRRGRRRRRPAASRRPRSVAIAGRCRPPRSPGSRRELALPQWHLPLLPVAGLDAATTSAARRSRRCGRAVSDVPRRRARATPQVVVCCGSGGVGKTTTAAVHRARGWPGSGGGSSSSRSTRPAGWPTRSGCPTGWPPSRSASTSPDADGELWAMMLDTAATFDGVVRAQRRRRRAGRADPRQPLLPQHRRRAQRHAGVHGRRDAAPAARRRALRPRRRRHAAEPQRPRLPRGARRAGPLPRPPAVPAADAAGPPRHAGASTSPTQPMLRAIGRVVGSDVLADAVAFFQAFAGMEAGFRDRADDVIGLLRSDATRYVLVASPHRDTVDRGGVVRRQARRARDRRGWPAWSTGSTRRSATAPRPRRPSAPRRPTDPASPRCGATSPSCGRWPRRRAHELAPLADAARRRTAGRGAAARRRRPRPRRARRDRAATCSTGP